jgi:hypothetical protein
MSKQETTFFKGIALMMMLWYHLFGLEDMDDLAHHIFLLKDIHCPTSWRGRATLCFCFSS